MKVLHVIPSVSAIHGGPSIAIRMIEHALADRGIHVETVTTDDDGPGSHLSIPLGQPVIHGRASRWYFRKNSEFYKVSWALMRWMLREVRRFDVVHVHALFSFASVVTALAARRAGVPYVIRPLGVLGRYGLDQRRPLVKRLSLKWIEGPLLREAAAVHVTSPAEQVDVLALRLPLSPAIIPLGLERATEGDPERLFEKLPGIRGGMRVLFLSRIDPKKNLEGLIRALGELRRSGFQATLMVGGTGDRSYIEELTALASAEDVAPQVVWLGHISGEMKADALAVAHVFALPSHEENFGIAAAEALMAGIPCLLGRGVALSSEVAAAGAGLAVAPDPRSIAAALGQLLTDESVRSSMAASAAAFGRERFSLDSMGQALENLYRDICRRPTGADGRRSTSNGG